METPQAGMLPRVSHWQVAAMALAVALVVVLVLAWSTPLSQLGKGAAGQSGDVAEPQGTFEAGTNLVNFLNLAYGGDVGIATLVSVAEEAGNYKVTINAPDENGQPKDYVVFVSRDGKFFFPQVVDIPAVLEQIQQAQNAPVEQPATAAVAPT